jgi:hypothetical protein
MSEGARDERFRDTLKSMPGGLWRHWALVSSRLSPSSRPSSTKVTANAVTERHKATLWMIRPSHFSELANVPEARVAQFGIVLRSLLRTPNRTPTSRTATADLLRGNLCRDSLRFRRNCWTIHGADRLSQRPK